MLPILYQLYNTALIENSHVRGADLRCLTVVLHHHGSRYIVKPHCDLNLGLQERAAASEWVLIQHMLLQIFTMLLLLIF